MCTNHVHVVNTRLIPPSDKKFSCTTLIERNIYIGMDRNQTHNFNHDGYWQYSIGRCKSTYQTMEAHTACIVHLIIKRTNWPYVKTISCSGSHKKHKVCKGPSNDWFPTGSPINLWLEMVASLNFQSA